MSAILQRAKERYAIFRNDACRTCALDLQNLLKVPINIGDWSNRAREAYEVQWSGHPARRTGWNWPEIHRRYRDPDALHLAVWSNRRLAGLLLATTSNTAVTINFFEGDPWPDCPLKGRRVLVALDVTARYAQARGRSELRVEPLNSDLECLYRDIYGFQPVYPRSGLSYYARKV